MRVLAVTRTWWAPASGWSTSCVAKRGLAWVFGDGSARLNPIHGADLAAVALGNAPRVTGAPLWLVDAALPAMKPVNRR